MHKIVIALGGNALGTNISEQARAVRVAANAIADLIEDGNQVTVVHGNGPQVGMIENAMAALRKEDARQEDTPLTVCGAMSQAYIGYDLQNALGEELRARGLDKQVVTVVTQVEVNPEDPAFANPTKPIGKFYTREEGEELAARTGCVVQEDAGRGYRRFVASPEPVDIVEAKTIRELTQAGTVVISCGGGGVPVVRRSNRLEGVAAVIDKDFAAELLAEKLDADLLMILTAVERVAVDFGKQTQRWLSTLTVENARRYIAEQQFAKGSMLPKVEAAVRFVQSKPGRIAVITQLEKAKEGAAGKTGTVVRCG